MPIPFDFKYYYFALYDYAASPHYASTGVTISVGGPMASTMLSAGAFFYYDSLLTGLTLVTITLSASSTTILYNASITVITFNNL